MNLSEKVAIYWFYMRWQPLKFIIRRMAISRGFADPFLLLARLAQFGQPSDVAAPNELLRATAILHARGLINSQTIQYNMDWVWPYWITRQFNPKDNSFIPRAFSLTHINLTQRNWTAVGLPDFPELPIIDARGMVTPWLDGWSVDGWVIADKLPPLIPSRAISASQEFLFEKSPSVVTRTESEGMHLKTVAEVIRVADVPTCRMTFTVESPVAAKLAISLRPYNPEGISFINDITLHDESAGWSVNGGQLVFFGEKPDSVHFSHFRQGDVYHQLQEPAKELSVRCSVGMASAAVLFAVRPNEAREVFIDIPLGKVKSNAPPENENEGAEDWSRALAGNCQLKIPNAHWQFLYDAALRSLILHSPGDIYPGPYTYKRFWFRDAAFIVHGLLCAGLAGRAEKVIDLFPKRQTPTGYFLSQEGEWDSNGEGLWAIAQFCSITGRAPKPEWKDMIYRAAGWIRRKRIPAKPDSPQAGLFPPGYSAEHLGPSDYYYWDDFWGVLGLRAAAALIRAYGDTAKALDLEKQADDFMLCIERSLKIVSDRFGHPAMPAGPYRRMDAGAIGSITVGYPLKLWNSDDPRLLATANYLVENCFYRGGFFQEMSHSGVNPYLTLHVAQVFLRAGDSRAAELMRCVAELASPTGQWPEAIHPWSGGGCMGDGQHIWAAAEWMLLLRNCFVREEGGQLILGSGILPEWLSQKSSLAFGPAPTEFGPISVQIDPDPDRPRVRWTAAWHKSEPVIKIHLAGFHPETAEPGQTLIRLKPL